MINLIVDYRERAFIGRLSNYITITNEVDTQITIDGVEFVFRVTNLQVGDFVIEDCKDCKLVIERKTYGDLSSSITDGRFRQQKERLEESIGDVSKIVFVIEGDRKGKRTLPGTTISSAIINMVFKHGYKVLCTENEEDTFSSIMLLIKKLHLEEFDKGVQPVAPVKLVSRGSKITDNLMAIQLSAIPGVSFQTAMCIAKYYPTMKELVTAYNKCDEEIGGNLLRDIIINEKRKIGTALSKKIHRACCGTSSN